MMNTTTKIATIVGNGLSRQPIDLSKFKQLGPIFGCNALYREFDPDYLVAFDTKIVEEIKASTFPKEKLIVPPWDEQFEPAEANPNRPRNNAGMVAMKEAIKLGHNKLYLLGMDFVLEDRTKNEGNIYDGTNAYDASTRASYGDTLNRCRFFNWFTLQYPNVEFIFVLPNGKYDVRVAPTTQVQFQEYEGMIWK